MLTLIVAAVLTLIALYLIKWLTPLATLLYQMCKALEEGGSRLAQGCYSGMRPCAAKARDTVHQDRKLSARLTFLPLASVIIAGETSIMLLSVPVLFHIKNSTFALPVSLEEVAGLLIVALGLFLGRLLLEFTGLISDPAAQFFPHLSKAKRVTYGCLTGLAMVIYIADMAYIAYFRQRILDHLQVGLLDLDIVYYLAFPAAVALYFSGYGFEIGFSAVPPIALALAAAVCGAVGFLCHLVAWLFRIPYRVIELLNPHVRKHLPELDEDDQAGPFQFTPVPPVKGAPAMPKETGRFVVGLDVGPAHYRPMTQTLQSAGNKALAFGSVDGANQTHPVLHIAGAHDISPTQNQKLVARNAARSKKAPLLPEQMKALNINLREIYARYIGPTPLLISFGWLEMLSQVAGSFASLRSDLGGHLKHLAVAAPSAFQMNTSSLHSIYQEAASLQQAAELDACLLYTANSPLVERLGDEEALHFALANCLGKLIVGQFAGAELSFLELLGTLKSESPVWSFAFCSSVVVGDEAPWWHPATKGLAGHLFRKHDWYDGKRADPSDTITQAQRLVDHIQHDPTTRGIEIPINPSGPMIFLFLLPFQSNQPDFDRITAEIHHHLGSFCRFPMPIFLRTPGIPEVGMDGKLIASLFCLYPIVTTALVPAQVTPQGIGAPVP